MTYDTANFMRRKPDIDRQRYVVKPEFGFLFMCANMHVGRLVAFVGKEKGAVRSPSKNSRHEPLTSTRYPGSTAYSIRARRRTRSHRRQMPRFRAANRCDRDRPVKRRQAAAVLYGESQQICICDLVRPQNAAGIEQRWVT